ncbi:MAG: signal recognition particle protein [Planctomycetales bacterium]
MFETITANLTSALKIFTGTGKLTEANIREGLQQVRNALLEADVNYEVADDFIKNITDEAIGQKVIEALRPQEQFLGIVYNALIDLMGPVDHSLNLKDSGISIVMMCGLQGSGKTTTCGKLAKLLLEQGKRAMLVAADLQRPAAIEQLKVIGEQVGVPVYTEPPTSNPVAVCQNALQAAKSAGNVQVLILDTAGRLHVDQALMKELEEIDRRLNPSQILFVCDAMTGQDAVNSARAFNDALELDGVILTKLDGDARGGAALSVKQVTGVPIKFIGMGEQLDKLEPFHPDRMAGRILGQGDILTLAEKAQRALDADQMAKAQEEMLQGKFTLESFRDTMKNVQKIGSMKDILKMLGMGGMLEQMPNQVDPEGEMKKIEGMINSMTPDERKFPERIDINRRRRIAKGSGTEPADVNRLLKDFENMAAQMQKVSGLGMRDRMRAVREMSQAAMMNPHASMMREKQRSKAKEMDADKKKKLRKEAKAQRKKNKRR